MRTPGPYLLLAKDVWWPNRTPSNLVVPFVALLLTLAFTSKWFRDIIMLLNTPIRNASTGLTYCGKIPPKTEKNLSLSRVVLSTRFRVIFDVKWRRIVHEMLAIAGSWVAQLMGLEVF